MQSIFDERLWLAWLVKVRILVLTLLLGIELAIARLTPNPFPLRLFIDVILLWYAVSIFYLLLLSFWEERRIQSVLQVITDLIMVTLVVYATGGVDSSLNFFYPLVITVACILLPRIWAYLTGALAFILYVAVLELTYFEVIPSYSSTHPGMGALQAIIFVNLFGYLAVAYLAGLLAAKLHQVDVKLKYTSGALEDLQALHENIIQSISGGLITTGLDGYITLANPAAQKLFERSESEFLGQAVEQLFLDPLPIADSERAHGQHAIIGRNKVVPIAGHQDGAPSRPHARINHHQMHRARREVVIRLRNHQRAIQHIEGLDGMADIHDFSLGRNGENDAFDRPHEVIVEPKIGSQRDDRTMLQFPLACRQSFSRKCRK